MTASSPSKATVLAPLSEAVIRRRIDGCPKLASLESINSALAGLLRSEQSYNGQIAEIIRRDPSLTARLLRMVNSVYFGLSAKVNNIEEAVLYLGLRQIRELSMATPVIEELQKITDGGELLPWTELWQHSIGSAVLTREILSATSVLVDDDTDYIVGLLHNVGKVVMASCFPEHFSIILSHEFERVEDVCAFERSVIGWDHAEIGAAYLERNNVSPEIVAAVRWHNQPEQAGEHCYYAAAVQVADQLVRHFGIRGGFENVPTPAMDSWKKLSGWNLLFQPGLRETSLAEAAIANTLRRLPSILSGLS